MAIALGRSAQDEYRDNLHKVSKRLQGQCGLLFTNKNKEEVLDWFSSHTEDDFARAGNVATKTVVLSEGPLEQFPFSLEPFLRLKLGMQTSLKKGQSILTGNQ